MHVKPADDEAPHRRLVVDFGAWLGQPHIALESYFRQALVVLDANVLLDLYRMTPGSRNQVLAALNVVAGRLWVPYQAALEFSRNRRRVVVDRVSSFKHSRQLLRAASVDALEALESALTQLVMFRERNNTTRSWARGDHGLDQKSLAARLAGVMDPALAELDALEAEHDLHPHDLQRSEALLMEIDSLLTGRIGPHYQADELRRLVEEAQHFRYPNQIPPGYLDAGKENPLRAAGDYLLWRQTLDRAARLPDTARQILLITSDMKADWWQLDGKGRPQGPRPELVQEMRDAASADLLLMSLKDFVAGAGVHLDASVSKETLDQLAGAEKAEEVDIPEVDDDLAVLTAREREVLAGVAEGLTNREIGEKLFISERTVGVHVGHIFDKLQVRTRVQASRVFLTSA